MQDIVTLLFYTEDITLWQTDILGVILLVVLLLLLLANLNVIVYHDTETTYFCGDQHGYGYSYQMTIYSYT